MPRSSRLLFRGFFAGAGYRKGCFLQKSLILLGYVGKPRGKTTDAKEHTGGKKKEKFPKGSCSDALPVFIVRIYRRQRGEIVCGTDGVPEAADNENQLYGTQRMIEALNKDPEAAPEAVLNNVLQSVGEFVHGAEQFDDLTMLCVEYKGKTQDQ